MDNFLPDMIVEMSQTKKELVWIFVGIVSVLTLCTIVFYIFLKTTGKNTAKELLDRTFAWWGIALGFSVITFAPLIWGTLIFTYVSFVALREMLTISPVRQADRVGLLVAYLGIPVQYFLAYNNFHDIFLIFIPLFMFIIIPFALVLKGNMKRVGRSMSIIPAILVLTVFLLSHVIMVCHLEFPEKDIGGRELLVFLIVLTAFNDVFQYIWGKFLGRHKILPLVSPNKTWEGFVGGILTTAGLGLLLRFLTPFEPFEAILISLGIGFFGFVGDALISAIKRDLKLKDTSNLLPGHGGAMDRLDSLLLTAPFFYHTIYLGF
jgi:phosphatidate cytidylyltransferase